MPRAFLSGAKELVVTRRARLWRAGAVLFGIINIGGMGIALAMDEMMHAMAHVFLLFVAADAGKSARTCVRAQSLPRIKRFDIHCTGWLPVIVLHAISPSDRVSFWHLRPVPHAWTGKCAMQEREF